MITEPRAHAMAYGLGEALEYTMKEKQREAWRFYAGAALQGLASFTGNARDLRKRLIEGG